MRGVASLSIPGGRKLKVQDCRPGQRVRVVQSVDRREGNWRTEVVGVVQSVELGKTGSWFAPARNGKLWLLRIRLRKDDGELTTIVADPLTEVELLDDAPAAG